MRITVRFEAAVLVENNQQCDVQWLYSVCMGNIQYVCIGFKKEVIHSIQLDVYTCMWLMLDL